MEINWATVCDHTDLLFSKRIRCRSEPPFQESPSKEAKSWHAPKKPLQNSAAAEQSSPEPNGLGKKSLEELLTLPVQTTQHIPVDFGVWSPFHDVA